MRSASVTKAKRIAAGVMGLTLLLVIALSALFLVAEADHDCAGEDCPICACLQACVHVLRRFGASAIILVTAVASVILFLSTAVASAAVFTQETPVSRGIRLNN
ncbi:MAG: hypothetical protein IKT07_05515 [Oscillospiraceae bacterium]|nr:hypothetical protein [Oscillospiraceae bacterium]